jgi:hypothetical protein
VGLWVVFNVFCGWGMGEFLGGLCWWYMGEV